MENKGIHRAKTWQMALFALNNTSTNLWLVLLNFVAYYLTGYVGVAVVLATSVMTFMRIWDAITDPIVGYILDKTDGKFGKNRPFMAAGNVVLVITTFLMFFTTHHLPEQFRFIYFLVIYLIYIIGYTLQTVVTKSAQSCLTNDPKQRPTFGIYDGIYNAVLFALVPGFVAQHLVPKYGGFTAELFQELWMYIAPITIIFTWLAIFALRTKDRTEYFGTGKPVKVTFKDYWDVLKNNRAIQMLVVSASTDKLASMVTTNATVQVIIFGIIIGDFKLLNAFNQYTLIPKILIMILGVRFIAQRLGQRKALLWGSWAGIILNALVWALFYIGDPTSFSLPGSQGFTGFTFFTIVFLTLNILAQGANGVAGTMVIPMTADCADYEVYRTGRYVPGLMGTLFSAVDKIVSSFGAAFVGILCAAIGFTDKLPTVDTPYSNELKFIGLVMFSGFIIFGYICNVIAMKFYPLNKEKMEEIQKEIARIKEEALAE